MVKATFALFGLLTLVAGVMTYMNVGLEETKFDNKASIRAGSHGGVYVGGGYRNGK